MGDIRSVVNVQNVSKKFFRKHRLSVKYALRDMAREALSFDSAPSEILRPSEFWAVQDISFSLSHMDSLGIVGTNGSGKTTLLKMVSGIIKPTKGIIQTTQRITPLFARGLGFDPVLSGIENISVNLLLLGLDPSLLKKAIEEVAEFSELSEESLNAPIKGYSSGMLARLSFACAVNTRPDIMIVDEALAVGDLKFRTKCYRKLTELRNTGTSFVMVSHSLNTIIANCEMALYMAEGKKVAYGPAKQVVSLYEEHILTGENPLLPISAQKSDLQNLNNFSDVKITNVEFLNTEGATIPEMNSGETVIIRLHGESAIAVDELYLCYIFKDLDGEFIHLQNIDSYKDNIKISIKAGVFTFDLKLDPCCLRAGLYTMKFYLTSGKGLHILDAVESYRFKVKAGKNMNQCLFYQPRSWNMEQGAEKSPTRIV